MLVIRYISRSKPGPKNKSFTTAAIYFCSAWIFMLGMTYAGVPLYRMFCAVRIFKSKILTFFSLTSVCFVDVYTMENQNRTVPNSHILPMLSTGR